MTALSPSIAALRAEFGTAVERVADAVAAEEVGNLGVYRLSSRGMQIWTGVRMTDKSIPTA